MPNLPKYFHIFLSIIMIGFCHESSISKFDGQLTSVIVQFVPSEK